MLVGCLKLYVEFVCDGGFCRLGFVLWVLFI